MNETIQLTKETKAIVDTYTLIYKLVFKYSIYMLVFLASLGFQYRMFGQLALSNDTPSNTVINYDQAKVLKNRYENLLSQRIDKDGFHAYFVNGYLGLTGNQLQSANNLLSFRGFIMPNYLSIDRNLPLEPSESFENPDYQPENLNFFIKNIVLTSKQELPTTSKNSSLALSDGSIVKTFNLECTQNPLNAVNVVCQSKVKDFLQYFFVYSIEEDITGLKNVFENIQSSQELKKGACDGIFKRLLYANTADEKFENFMNVCGMKNSFTKLRGFTAFQQELQNIVNPINYFDPTINAYKLLSLQQLIYNNLQNNSLNESILNVYFEFVRKLLRDPNISLDPIYFDITYIYNNTFLTELLKKPEIANFNQNTATLNTINQQIRQLNLGDPLLGYSGLNSTVTNSSILLSQSGTQSSSTGEQRKPDLQLQLWIKNQSFIRITKSSINEGTAVVEGIVPADQQIKEQLSMTLTLQYTSNDFRIQTVQIQNYPQLSQTINDFLISKPLSFNQLYDTFLTKIDLYSQQNQPTFDVCSLITQNVQGATLTSCSTTGIQAQFKNLTYKRTIKNNDITSYNVSNSDLQRALVLAFNDPQTTNDTLAKTISQMLLLQLPTSTTSNDQVAFEKAKVFEDIQASLGIQPTDVLKVNSSYLVQFTVQGISFIAMYNPQTKTLSRFYFAQKNKGGSRISINKFQISLLLTGQETLNSFLTDPLGTIKIVDPLARAAYTQ